tara:strand:- start:539 stop:1153 length:615 start_codon:yes stop_codon:yes gene_type:complete
MNKALKLETKGDNKSYKVVSADQYSKMVIEDYNPRFIQLYDENNILIELQKWDNGRVITIEEIENNQWTINPCGWRNAKQYVRKEKTVDCCAYFTSGRAEGTGSIKKLLQGRLPDSIQKDVKNLFLLAETGMDLSAASDALVGGIDALIGLTEDLYYQLIPTIIDYWKTCKGGNANLSHDEEQNLLEILSQNVLQYTQIDRSLA